MAAADKKSDRRVVRSKEALRASLLELMTEQDFGSISITEIVGRANYNRGTFYSHYDSKKALLDDIISELIEDMLRSYRAPYENVEIFHIDELGANSILIFEHFYQHADVYQILFKSDVLPNVRERMLVALKQIAMEDLEYTNSEIDQELMAVYSIHALLGLVFHWIESGFKVPPSYMQDQLIKLIHYRPRTAVTINRNAAPSPKGKNGTPK